MGHERHGRRRGGLRRAALHLGGLAGVATPLLGLLAIWMLHTFTRTGEAAHEADYRAALNFQLTLLVVGTLLGLALGAVVLAQEHTPLLLALLAAAPLLPLAVIAVPALAFLVTFAGLRFPYPALPFVRIPRARGVRTGSGSMFW